MQSPRPTGPAYSARAQTDTTPSAEPTPPVRRIAAPAPRAAAIPDLSPQPNESTWLVSQTTRLELDRVNEPSDWSRSLSQRGDRAELLVLILPSIQRPESRGRCCVAFRSPFSAANSGSSAGAATLRQLFAGDEHPPGMPDPYLPFLLHEP